MGPKGQAACCVLAPPILLFGVPPLLPCQFSFAAAAVTEAQHVELMQQYQIEDSGACDNPCIIFACYPYQMWKHTMFLKEMSMAAKAAKLNRQEPLKKCFE
mmetsp:Transcript_44513/g.117627  ORF Transcript_44513/g.117627 Transcript_44513/m.117627 type:complete len:101 (-) Transcript_44513:164-466(-)